MKRFLALSLILSGCAAVHAEPPATQPAATQPSTQPAFVGDASYGLGYSVGKQMASLPAKLDAEKLYQGIKDALDGKKSAVSNEAFQEAMAKLEQEALIADKAKAMKNGADGDAYRAENAKKNGVETTKTGLQIEHLKVGQGESPKATDKVKVHYTGTLLDGTKFDSSVDRGEPITFALNRVIPGWTEGLQLMKVGGKARLVIPAAIAYGPEGRDEIPPNATLIFEVELLDIVK